MRDVIEGENVNLEEYGIEEEGPVPLIEESETVAVPESPDLSAVPPDENGIMAYLTAVGVLARLLHS